MYKVLNRVEKEGVDAMKQAASSYLREQGMAIVKDCNKKAPVEYVQALLDLKVGFLMSSENITTSG